MYKTLCITKIKIMAQNIKRINAYLQLSDSTMKMNIHTIQKDWNHIQIVRHIYINNKVICTYYNTQ